MVWSEVRLSGDPFAATAEARALRAFLHVARARGFRVAIALGGARGDGDPSGRKVTLGDGTRTFEVWTRISEAELAICLEAAARAVAATAPLVVFGDLRERTRAELDWPQACLVLEGQRAEPNALVTRIEAELAKVPEQTTGWRESELQPFLELAVASQGNTFLHLGSADPSDGTDLVVAAFARLSARTDCELLIASGVRDPEHEAALGEAFRRHSAPGVVPRIAFHGGVLDPQLFRDIAAIVLPLRKVLDATTLVTALASGRPVVVTRTPATAELCGGPATVLGVGGRSHPHSGFEPDLRSLEHAMGQVLTQRLHCVEMAARARAHVLTHLRRGAPALPAVERRGSKPRIVLETPLFTRSSTTVLTLATARALQERGRVEVQIVPSLVSDAALAQLQREAPLLAPLVTGRPAEADLWVAAGWPPRQARPRARTFAVRFDWEYGALPTDLTPLVTESADRILVHSAFVQRTVTAAGRELASVVRVPHGVDGTVFHETAEPSAEVVAWKRGRKALLFVGGLIWRKGFDLLLKVLAERHRDAGGLCLVVKSTGVDSSYRGFELGALLDRYARTPGALPTLHVQRDLAPEEMAGLYRACDLLVHPYRGEGFGMPILEARACGLPVLVTAGGAADDLRIGPDDASFVPIPSTRRTVELPMPCEGPPFVLEPDTVRMGELLDACLAELPALTEVARATAPLVRELWTWDAAAQALEALTFAAAGERARPAPVAAGVGR